MPNHVDNIVYMKGIGTRAELFEKTKDGDINLDFNKIAPMPEELFNASSPMIDATVDLALKVLLMRLRVMPHYKYNGEFRKFCSNLESIKINLPKFYEGNEVKALEDGLTYINNIVKYEYPTWYDWCCTKWGTKWNAYWGSILGDDVIRFTTAWDIPYNIYILLSQQNPYDEIIVDWVNEGGIFGQTRFLDGDMIEEKVYKYTDNYDDEWDRDALFHKVELIEHSGKF